MGSLEIVAIVALLALVLGYLAGKAGKTEAPADVQRPSLEPIVQPANPETPQPFKPPPPTLVSDKALKAYVAADSLFVERSEYALFCLLDRAAPNGLRVMTKVRLEDIVNVRKGIPEAIAWKLRARVKSRHVDFVICDHRGKVLCAIELDGKSHTPGNLADENKDRLFARVGIPLHRIRVGDKFAPRVASIMADLSPG